MLVFNQLLRFLLIALFSTFLLINSSFALELKQPTSDSKLTSEHRGFTKILQTTSDVQEAQVVVIGDYHGDNNYQGHLIRALDFIEHLGRDKDILLLEHYDDQPVSLVLAPPLFKPLKDYLPDSIEVFGWSPKKLDLAIASIQKSLTEKDRSDEKESLDWALHAEVMRYFINTYRNRYLANIIKSHLKRSPQQKIFITIGTLHLDDIEFLDFLKKSDFTAVAYQSVIALEFARKHNAYLEQSIEELTRAAIENPENKRDVPAEMLINRQQMIEFTKLPPLDKMSLWRRPEGQAEFDNTASRGLLTKALK